MNNLIWTVWSLFATVFSVYCLILEKLRYFQKINWQKIKKNASKRKVNLRADPYHLLSPVLFNLRIVPFK